MARIGASVTPSIGARIRAGVSARSMVLVYKGRTMKERELLLKAVCDNPDDDTPRLVFADWLQEHGDEERAEFIRLQIQLARMAYQPKEAGRLRRREIVLLARTPLWKREVVGADY